MDLRIFQNSGFLKRGRRDGIAESNTYKAIKDIFAVQCSHPSTTVEVPGHDEDQAEVRRRMVGRRRSEAR